jgi:hypothetical protein
MRIGNILTIATLCVIAACGDEASYAPTGAKRITDDFGNAVYVDEECGDPDAPAYADAFQNALFRDGAIYGHDLWLVDGAHVWRASLDGTYAFPAEGTDGTLRNGKPTPRLTVPFAGHTNAITAGDGFVAAALVERGVAVYPGGDVSHPVFLTEPFQAVDVDARGSLLAVGDRNAVWVYDLATPANPLPLYHQKVNGAVVGVAWRQGTLPILYYAACSYIGRFDFRPGFSTPDYLESEQLGHRNAKDIAATSVIEGDGNVVLVANNGAGFWGFTTYLAGRYQYDQSDPDYYANAVAIGSEGFYLAAGNQQLEAITFDGRARSSYARDPLGVLVDRDVVYGFGNFREVGERTVVRAPEMYGNDRTTFNTGYAPFAEPGYVQPAEVPSTGARRVSLFADGEHRVYERAATEAAWRRVPGLQFYGNAGTFTVEVGADNVAMARWGPATDAAAKVFDLNLTRQFDAWHLQTFDRGLLMSVDVPSGRATDFFGLGTSGAEVALQNLEPAGLPAASIVWARFDAKGAFEKVGHLVDAYLNVQGHDDPYLRLIGGARTVADCTVTWFSRQLEIDAGKLDALTALDFCGAPVNLPIGGIIDVQLGGDGWLLLQDNRKANTAAVIFLDDRSRETRRWVLFGRPSGFTYEHGYPRVWFADGSSFAFDPFADELVKLDEIGPVQP